MIDLVAGTDHAAIDAEAGGRLSSLVAGGRERILQSPSPVVDLASIGCGSFVMAPFVGRLRHGSVDWRGRHADVPRNLGRHAIHGAVFDVPWSVVDVSPNAARLSVRLDPARWPFGGEVREDVTLDPGRLVLGLEIVADEEMPAAAGWHPWFRLERGDDVTVRVDADTILETGPELIPTGRTTAVDARTDLRIGRHLSELDLDHTYVDVRSPVVITWPDLELEMAFASPLRSVVVFTPPGAFCVEPQSAWPDALRLQEEGIEATGLAIVPAGGTFRAETTWTWRRRG